MADINAKEKRHKERLAREHQNLLKQINELVEKEPAALTEGERVFLRARRSYLTQEQADKFAEVLGNKKPSKKKDGDSEE